MAGGVYSDQIAGHLQTGVSANLSVPISTMNWKSERRTQGSQAHDIPDRSLVPPRMFVATVVESRFAAQTRCKFQMGGCRRGYCSSC